jgi:N-sulfoglucosamine sulfohydrolase
MVHRPHLQGLVSDDWGRYAGAYADRGPFGGISRLLETPAFDRVAREGVLFENAYVTAPSCTPCRSSLLSGRYFWQTGLGAILLGAVWDETIPTFPLELEKNGWFIGHTYKVWSPGKSYNAPYGGRRTSYEGAGVRFNRFSHEAVRRAETIGMQAAKQELLGEVRDNFLSFLDARPEGKPFCYWWGPTNTHRTWEKGSGNRVWGMDPEQLKGRMPAFIPDVPEVREDFNDYLGECLAVDAGLDVLLSCLEQRGELDDTLVIVSGDHGIPGMPRAKCNLYDIGLQVPLAVRMPDRVPGGRVVSDFVNLMDLAPTLLEAAGVAIPDGMTASSLWSVLTSTADGQVDASRDFVVTGRERHVDTAREGCLPYPQRAIRTRDHLLIVNFAPDRYPMGDPGLLSQGGNPIPYERLEADTHVVYADMDAGPTKAWMVWNREQPRWREHAALAFGKRPLVELYDITRDPAQMHNVAGQAAYAEVQRELENRLFRSLMGQQDPRVVEAEEWHAGCMEASNGASFSPGWSSPRGPFSVHGESVPDCCFEHAPYAGPQQPFQLAPFGWPDEG